MPSLGVRIGVLLKNLIPDSENILVGFCEVLNVVLMNFVFGPSTLILLIWLYRCFHLKVTLYLSKPYCVGIFVVFFSVYLFFGSIPLLQLACQLFQSIYSYHSYKIVPTLSHKSLLHLFKPNCVAVFILYFFIFGGEGGGCGHLLVSIRMPTFFSWYFGSNWWPISTYHMLWTYNKKYYTSCYMIPYNDSKVEICIASKFLLIWIITKL